MTCPNLEVVVMETVLSDDAAVCSCELGVNIDDLLLPGVETLGVVKSNRTEIERTHVITRQIHIPDMGVLLLQRSDEQ